MKKWYTSKTLWANFIAAVAMFVQNQYGYVIDPQTQAYILLFVNVVLRTVTKESLSA